MLYQCSRRAGITDDCHTCTKLPRTLGPLAYCACICQSSRFTAGIVYGFLHVVAGCPCCMLRCVTLVLSCWRHEQEQEPACNSAAQRRQPKCCSRHIVVKQPDAQLLVSTGKHNSLIAARLVQWANRFSLVYKYSLSLLRKQKEPLSICLLVNEDM
jgi:hypothetical protein